MFILSTYSWKIRNKNFDLLIGCNNLFYLVKAKILLHFASVSALTTAR